MEPGTCCSSYRKTACKSDNKVYEIGEQWPSSSDPCKTYNCTLNREGDAEKEMDREKCNTDCNNGYTYTQVDGQCCGSCVKTHCIMQDGRKLLPGENVTSSSGCYTTSCNLQNAEPKLFVDKPNCPSLNCGIQFQVLGEDGCCNVCPKPATLKMCAPVPVSDTAGMVREEVGGHGVCTNAQAVPGWTECKGTCFSGTRYSHGMALVIT